MTQITEKQLIESLKQLKEIKPNKEWASLLKSQILAERQVEPIQAKSVNFIDILSSVFAPRKLVYSFAVILFLVVGILGLGRLTPSEKTSQQVASLTNQTSLVVKDQINTTAKNIVQNLKNNPTQNPQEMKILAKTLADIPGDVASSSEVKDLVQTVVAAEIIDLQKTMLTDKQETTLTEAVSLYNQGKYTEALEILVISN